MDTLYKERVLRLLLCFTTAQTIDAPIAGAGYDRRMKDEYSENVKIMHESFDLVVVLSRYVLDLETDMT